MLAPGRLNCWLFDSLIFMGACAHGPYKKQSREKGGSCLQTFLELAMQSVTAGLGPMMFWQQRS